MSQAALAEAQANLILLFSSPRDALRTRASSKSDALAKAAYSKIVWQFYSELFFGQSLDTNDICALIRGFSQSYAAAKAVGADLFKVTLPLPPHWLAVWQGLHAWASSASGSRLGSNFRLRGPASPEIFKELEDNGLPMAPEVAGMWQVHDGQECRFPDEESGINFWSGLFGGYSVYDHSISTRLLPLRAALDFTLEMRARLPNLKTKLFFAASGYSKLFLVDVTSGDVSVISPGNRSISYEKASSPSSDSEPRTGLLRWFREHVRRLNEDFYPVLPLDPRSGPSTLGLCLCPQAAPEATCCVTNGVEVRASCAYMPEHPQGWTYSISCRLVGSAAERGFEQCQLHTRTWRIQEDGGTPQEVHGEGVIGLFPILVDNGWLLNSQSDPHSQYRAPQGLQEGSFRYQSCSGRSPSMRGSFGGFITFVPGTIRKPTGAPFQAHLEPFRMCVPEFIY
mmetsp:Transcript_9774/g.15652  ORF Transcript_9774/g.15652 Transcript_9774/m.15652 type:complete len:453 (-) Transcript_9774:100-1458(-)